MISTHKNNDVLLRLTKDEALVLLEWLSRFNEGENRGLFQDQAEERVLWDMEACIEQVISASFNSNYTEILAKAREKVRD